MTLVDTSIIVAVLDSSHPEHTLCLQALDECMSRDDVAVSAVTCAELAAGGRTHEAIDEDLRYFERVPLDFEAAFRAGQAFKNHRPAKNAPKPVPPDFLIRAQAAVLGIPHLTNDRRRTGPFPDVEFIFPRK